MLSSVTLFLEVPFVTYSETTAEPPPTCTPGTAPDNTATVWPSPGAWAPWSSCLSAYNLAICMKTSPPPYVLIHAQYLQHSV